MLKRMREKDMKDYSLGECVVSALVVIAAIMLAFAAVVCLILGGSNRDIRWLVAAGACAIAVGVPVGIIIYTNPN